MAAKQTVIPNVLKKYGSDLVNDWTNEQLQSLSRRSDLISDNELKRECSELMRLFQVAVSQSSDLSTTEGAQWKPVRDFLGNLTRTRAAAGFSPSETAIFVLSMKQPIFSRLRKELESNPNHLAEELWTSTIILDQLALYTTEVYQKSREEIIKRQQEDMLELSTPVVKLWNGILALPMIGTLDSARTQVVMETLLQRIVETGSEVAIIDITGVPHVDTLTAQHLLKTVTAARLMGADCIISGIRPQIAQTIVHLGVNLGDVTTKASLADAFQIALSRLGRAVVRANGNRKGAETLTKASPTAASLT